MDQTVSFLCQLANDCTIEKKKDLQSAIIISKITETLDAEQLKKAQSKLKSWEVDISKLIEQK